ncbi:MAG: hypothetical protein HQL08_08375 [Nitrospirae bacterium]|nr:hypothetical protein [Nitrospirota bacterium]
MNANGEPSETSVTAESGYSEAPKQEEPKQSEANMTQREAKVENKKASFLEAVHDTGLVAAKTVAGVGLGAAAGIGAVVAISIAEVTIPALLVVQIFSFAGGAVGFLKGLSKK